MAIGLKTQIWNNQAKSAMLLAGFPILLLAILFAVSMVYAPGPAADPVDAGIEGVKRYGHWAFAAAAGWFVIAYFSHERMIRSATHSREVNRSEAPRLYALLENLCISRGLAVPKLALMDSPALNAFASGIDARSYAITLTTGLVEALDEEELEGVIGHELTHIVNRDVRLMVIAVIFVGILGFLCEWFAHLRFFGGSRDSRAGGWGVLIVGAILFVGYLLSSLIRLAISRSREYLADAGAIELTRNPDAMIRALRKISGNAALPRVPEEMRQMMFENRAGLAGEAFATHPPIEKRIAALVLMGGRDEFVALAPAAPSASGPWSRLRRGPWGESR